MIKNILKTTYQKIFLSNKKVFKITKANFKHFCVITTMHYRFNFYQIYQCINRNRNCSSCNFQELN
ncbi:hypothetical protein KUTeg_003235 [Tegillarca granosa]|uniref:Uncharacterized protein n=1 Tax=Tegillarca granosa TaxID=220873 RepID=A0ABQ9FLJ1_TEGGR|nr:hypothetical protein KUTeg_003235 [Tegillarca granosa]